MTRSLLIAFYVLTSSEVALHQWWSALHRFSAQIEERIKGVIPQVLISIGPLASNREVGYQIEIKLNGFGYSQFGVYEAGRQQCA